MIEKYKAILCDRSPSFVAPLLKKRKRKGKQGGGRSWDKYVVQMVPGLLILGVPPNVIPGTIMRMYESLLGEMPSSVLSDTFVRECRDVVRIVCETRISMKLANSPC